jgi:C-terminal processing protease CtpA/Prc
VKRFAMVALLLAAPVTVRANVLPAGKDCKEFQVGVTGILAEIKGGVLSVTKTQPDTPAAGKLKGGDVLLAVDGASLEIQDPRHPLGFAINKAEGRDGKMTFAIRRGGEKRSVTIRLKAIGS